MRSLGIEVRVLAHAALLVAPVLALGRASQLARPQALSCVLALLVLAEVEAASRTANDPSGARAPGAALALTSALGLLGTAWCATGAPSFPTGGMASWTWLGAPMIAIGIALRAAAIRALGASFTSEIVAPPGHRLVTRGVYSRLRHPSDVGLLLVALGLATLGASIPAAVVVTLVVVPSVALRVVREDRALAERHPRAHADYRRAVRV